MNDLLSSLDIPLNDVIERKKPTGKVRKLLRHLDGNDYLMEVDWSSISNFLTCDRSAEHTLVFSRSTYPSPALVYGAAWHAAIEVWYKSGCAMDETTMNLATMTAQNVFNETPPPLGEWRTFDHFRTGFLRYLKQYEHEPFSILQYNGQPAVELSFSKELAVVDVNENCPYPKHQIVYDCEDKGQFFIGRIHIMWTGIIDLVGEMHGKTWIIDHKTASRTGSSYFQAFDLSQQIIGYVWAGQHLFGREMAGALMNVIVGRAATEKGKGTPYALERDFKPFTQNKIREWPLHMTSIIQDFIHHLTEGFFPMKTQWCSGKYGICPFFDVCSMDTDHDRVAVLMSDRYAPNVWHPIDGGGE